jgi:hypothetical protein
VAGECSSGEVTARRAKLQSKALFYKQMCSYPSKICCIYKYDVAMPIQRKNGVNQSESVLPYTSCNTSKLPASIAFVVRSFPVAQSL